MEQFYSDIIQASTTVVFAALIICWYRFYIKGQSGWQAFKAACKQIWPLILFLVLLTLSIFALLVFNAT
jgi:ABC-type microcin C transport system permease subunit YejE